MNWIRSDLKITPPLPGFPQSSGRNFPGGFRVTVFHGKLRIPTFEYDSEAA